MQYLISVQYLISARALADLEGIREYSTTTWGNAQAKKYIGGLLDQLRRITKHPDIGHPLDHVLPGIRMVTYQSHGIYYRSGEGTIEVVRILHGRMNPPLNL